uniref:Putative secreted protein n=1 Tax=Ixodes ricinus TaxID=34613 RepID=A0A147BDD8_IXORI
MFKFAWNTRKRHLVIFFICNTCRLLFVSSFNLEVHEFRVLQTGAALSVDDVVRKGGSHRLNFLGVTPLMHLLDGKQESKNEGTRSSTLPAFAFRLPLATFLFFLFLNISSPGQNHALQAKLQTRFAVSTGFNQPEHRGNACTLPPLHVRERRRLPPPKLSPRTSEAGVFTWRSGGSIRGGRGAAVSDTRPTSLRASRGSRAGGTASPWGGALLPPARAQSFAPHRARQRAPAARDSGSPTGCRTGSCIACTGTGCSPGGSPRASAGWRRLRRVGRSAGMSAGRSR